MRPRLTISIFLIIISVACSIATPPPPTRTPRPTITATRAATPTSRPTIVIVTQTSPPLEVATLPAGTPGQPDSTLPALTRTLEPTLTPTRRSVIVRPTFEPLTITNILLIGVERDPIRPNGAIASLQVVYSGGRAPYIIYHDETLQDENPFPVLTLCHGTLVHTIRLTSGDRQSLTKKYYLWPIDCPP